MSVEQVRTVEHFPDPRLDALESAARLCASAVGGEAAGDARRRDPRRVPRRLDRAPHRRRRPRVERRADPRSVRARSARQRHRGIAARRRRHHRARRPRGRVARRATRPDCSSGATVTRSVGASGPNCSRSRASPIAPGRCSRVNVRVIAHVALVVFTRDLRVTDHPALATAAADADQVVPVFVLDDAILSSSFNRPNRTGFLLESLDDLGRALTAARRAARDPARRLDRRGHASGPRRRRRRRAHVGGRQWLRATTRSKRSRTRASRRGSTSRPTRAPRWCRPGRSCLRPDGEHYKVFTPYYRRWLAAPRRALVPTPGRADVAARVRHRARPGAVRGDERHAVTRGDGGRRVGGTAPARRVGRRS